MDCHELQGEATLALIMDDPDAMAAVGKVWVHWLQYWEIYWSCDTANVIYGKNRLW